MLGELFEGLPSLTRMNMSLSDVAERDLPAMLLDVKSAFAYGATRYSVYIEFPRQGHNGWMGDLKVECHVRASGCFPDGPSRVWGILIA